MAYPDGEIIDPIKKVILLVDDSEINVGILSKIFKGKFDILTALSGDECLDIVLKQRKKVDLILLDILMPGLDGYEVMERLNKDPLAKRIPVIVTTALDSQASYLTALNHGAMDVIFKPYVAGIIMKRVENLFSLIEAHELKEEFEVFAAKTKNQIILDFVNESTGTIVFTVENDGYSKFLSSMKGYKISENFRHPGEGDIYPDDQHCWDSFLKEYDEKKANTVTIRLRRSDDSYRYTTVSIHDLHDEKTGGDYAVGTIKDVDKDYQYQQKILYLAEHDILTGVYNFKTFSEKAKEILAKDNRNYALIHVDISKFRIINQLYGETAGNESLKELAFELKTIPGDRLIGRIASDTFIVLMPYVEEKEIIATVERIKDLSSHANFIFDFKVLFGIYRIWNRNHEIQYCIDDAAMAKKKIDLNKDEYYYVYDDAMHRLHSLTNRLEKRMHDSLRKHEIVTYVQPKVDMRTGQVIGGEILSRWNYDGIIVMPDIFIPLFEENGFIREFDEYVWNEAAKFIKRLESLGLNIPISVNVSRINAFDSSLAEKIDQIVDKEGCERRHIVVELTETSVVDNDPIFRTLGRLKDKGFGISLDDFGKGYSSLNTLVAFPFDVIKLDRAFLLNTEKNERGKLILKSILDMRASIHSRIICEGVETEAQRQLLTSMGCFYCQGFLYSKPLKQDDFVAYCKEHGVLASEESKLI